MIQKLIGNTLYVLKKDAYKITRDVTDASIIFVNCNTIEDFRLLNPELDLSPYNYLLLRKTDPVYWPYVDMKDDAEFYFDQGI